MQHRRMRLLRKKHGVSMTQLSRHSDISHQRLYEIELGATEATLHMSLLVETAFSRLISERRRELSALESDFQMYRKTLLDYADEEAEHE